MCIRDRCFRGAASSRRFGCGHDRSRSHARRHSMDAGAALRPPFRWHDQRGSRALGNTFGRQPNLRSGARCVGDRAAIRRAFRRAFRRGKGAVMPHNLCARIERVAASFCRDGVAHRVETAPSCRAFAIQRDFVVWRSGACCWEIGRNRRSEQENSTEGGRDKSACHAVIQAAVAACLLACRAVGRWQVLRFYPGNPRLRSAQWASVAASLPGEAIR